MRRSRVVLDRSPLPARPTDRCSPRVTDRSPISEKLVPREPQGLSLAFRSIRRTAFAFLRGQASPSSLALSLRESHEGRAPGEGRGDPDEILLRTLASVG